MLGIQPALADETIQMLPIHDGHTLVKEGRNQRIDGNTMQITFNSSVLDIARLHMNDRMAIVLEGEDNPQKDCPYIPFDPRRHTLRGEPGFLPFDVTVTAVTAPDEKKAILEAKCMVMNAPKDATMQPK